MDYEKLREGILKHSDDLRAYQDHFALCREMVDNGEFNRGHLWNHEIRDSLNTMLRRAFEEKDWNLVQEYDALILRSLLFGAREFFDDYLQAVEYGKPFDKKFYAPRRTYLKRYVDAYQEILDGKLDFLSVSMPKRAISKDCPVLTPMGFVRHGDLHVGDFVYGESGDPVRVTAVHPTVRMEYAITFESGDVIVCSGDHEWKVVDRSKKRTRLVTAEEIMKTGVRKFGLGYIYHIGICPQPKVLDVYTTLKAYAYKNRIIDIVRLPENRFIYGNCITVEGGLYRVGLNSVLTHNCGKAVTLDTLIPTPFGFKQMRDIHVGDLVIARDGYDTKVTDVFPQGKVPVYEVKFDDGAVVKTCGEHLWEVKVHDSNSIRTSVMTTKEILSDGLWRTGKQKCHKYGVRHSEPVEFMFKEVALDPYVLGVLLGDGCLTDSSISLTKPDSEIFEYVRAHLPEGDECYCVDEKRHTYIIRSKERRFNEKGYPVKCKTAQIVEKLGLLGKRSHEKFVPDEYVFTTSVMRGDVLAGLLDTDGYTSVDRIEYSTTSPMLRDAVMFIVRSLGGKAKCSSRMGRYRKDGEIVYTRENYRVDIYFPSSYNPFMLSRKAEAYKPKREHLYHYIDSITPCGEAEAQCICVDNEEHLFLVGDYFVPTHNSQMGINFVNMLSGRKPDGSTLMEGTGDDLVRSFYTGCLEYLQQPNDYHYYDIFPEAVLTQTNAEMKAFNLQAKRRFPTVMCRSIDSRQVGLSEATNLLYLDDCVEGREEAKNRMRLDAKWEVISGDVIGRAIEGTPIVICGTRYSIYDPIGHLQEEIAKQGKRMKIIETPALDLVTDESNFEFELDGRKIFTTKYFKDQREMLSAEQFESEFQQQPFEAKGILFPVDNLKTFFELPVDVEPDAIVAVCDTADTGADFCSMPIAYVYGDDVFITDVLFDDAPPETTKPECARLLEEHKVSSCTFESNNAGSYFARDVDTMLKERGAKCSVRTKRTISNKRTRIEFASDLILKNFYFLHPSKYARNSQYAMFMKQVTSYTRSGKVPHDDAPDSLSLLENELRTRIAPKVEVIQRFF